MTEDWHRFEEHIISLRQKLGFKKPYGCKCQFRTPPHYYRSTDKKTFRQQKFCPVVEKIWQHSRKIFQIKSYGLWRKIT